MAKKKKKSKKKSKPYKQIKSPERLLFERELSLYYRRLNRETKKRGFKETSYDIFTKQYHLLQQQITRLTRKSGGIKKREYISAAKKLHGIRNKKVKELFSTPLEVKTEKPKTFSERMADLPDIMVGNTGEVEYPEEPIAEPLPYYSAYLDELQEYLSRSHAKRGIIQDIRDTLNDAISTYGRDNVARWLGMAEDKLPNLNAKLNYDPDLLELPKTINAIVKLYSINKVGEGYTIRETLSGDKIEVYPTKSNIHKSPDNYTRIMKRLKDISIELGEDSDTIEET